MLFRSFSIISSIQIRVKTGKSVKSCNQLSLIFEIFFIIIINHVIPQNYLIKENLLAFLPF